MTDLVTLTAGAMVLDIVPEIGGSIWRFEIDGVPILRGAGDGATGVLDGGCFPLVPYVNRIRGGRFTCAGREVVLAPNMPGDPSPLHGQGWLAAWNVETVSATTAKLGFTHAAGEWPWTYEAEQLFALDERGLTATLICRNLSAEPMPCGLGFHPYHPCNETTRLGTEVAGAFTVDEHILPVERVAAEGRFDLRDRQVCGQGLDNGFDGWCGSATMTWGNGLRLTMRSPTAQFFQLYSPTSGGLFVAEPVTHANCALNEDEARWPDFGLVMLAQDEAMTLEMRIEVEMLPKGGSS